MRLAVVVNPVAGRGAAPAPRRPCRLPRCGADGHTVVDLTGRRRRRRGRHGDAVPSPGARRGRRRRRRRHRAPARAAGGRHARRARACSRRAPATTSRAALGTAGATTPPRRSASSSGALRRAPAARRRPARATTPPGAPAWSRWFAGVGAGFDAVVNERANAMAPPGGAGCATRSRSPASCPVSRPRPYELTLDGGAPRALEAMLVDGRQHPVLRRRHARRARPPRWTTACSTSLVVGADLARRAGADPADALHRHPRRHPAVSTRRAPRCASPGRPGRA